MTEQERDYEQQREAEQTALRKVRGALDEIQTQEEKERKFKRRMVVAAPLIVLALFAGAVVLVRNEKVPEQYQVTEAQAIAVRTKVAHYIVVPAGVPSSAQVVVNMLICERGDLVGMGIAKSSGFPVFDDAVHQAASRFLIDFSNCVAKPGSVEIVFIAGQPR